MEKNIFRGWEPELKPKIGELKMNILETLGNPGLPLELHDWLEKKYPHLPKKVVIPVNALFFIVLTVWIFGFCWLWVPAFLITAIWNILNDWTL